MENWNHFFVNEELVACDTTFTVGELVLAVDMAKAMKDQETLKAKSQQLANSPFRRFLKRATVLAKPLAKLGLTIAGAGVAATGAVAAGPGATVALGALGAAAWVSMADDTAEVMGQLFAFGTQNEDNNAYQNFLETFCVDPETLGLIEDHYQQDYLEQSGIVEELKRYLSDQSNATKLIPDITNHLVDWLNTQSDYRGSDDTQMVATTQGS